MPTTAQATVPGRVYACIVLALLHGSASAAVPALDHRHPPQGTDIFAVRHIGHGNIPDQLFWRHHPDKSDPAKQEQARELNARRDGHLTIALMMWSSTFHKARNSDNPAWRAYYEWNDARRHYFARRPDGSIWSRSYENGGPKDAWITPTRVLDPEDRSPGIRTYGDWYADRIASFAAVTGFSGVTLADYADEIPHATVADQDYSLEIVEDFERWSGIDVSGDSLVDCARDIQANHMPRFTDYMCNAYAEFWMGMVNKIEDAVGRPAIMSNQKAGSGHNSRRRGADLRFIRKHARRADQVLYQNQHWMVPRSWGMGAGELSAHVMANGTQFCREPDVGRGVMLPCANTDSYHSSARKMELWKVVDDACEEHGLRLSDAEREELGNKSMLGTWIAITWSHLATRSGDCERAVNYVYRQNEWSYYPESEWNDVLSKRYPARPWGPAFYYSTAIEAEYEKGNDTYEPHDKIDDVARGNFFPGYFVSDIALENLKPENHPTCWITDHVDLLGSEELDALRRIAPVYDIDDIGRIPGPEAPLRFDGDASGFAFVDQDGKVIIVATRDSWKTSGGETVEVRIQGVADGTYSAKGLFSSEDESFTVSGGSGSFRIHLDRWETKAFETDLPALGTGVRK